MEKQISEHINNYIKLFNDGIKDTLFSYFQSKEIQHLINQKPDEIKIYLKKHYIKTFNLSLSTLLLSVGVSFYILPDEAKIIFRSLFEHVINFLYIFSFDTEEESIQLIRRFNDYRVIADFKPIEQFLKNWQDSNINENERTQIMYELYNKIYKEKNVESLKNDYQQKYNCKSFNSWHGLQMPQIINKLIRLYGDELHLFYKYYSDTNLFVHCNVMSYMNEHGVFVGNTRKNESLYILNRTMLFTLSYYEMFYKILNIDIKKEQKQIYEEFQQLEKKYFEIMKTT